MSHQQVRPVQQTLRLAIGRTIRVRRASQAETAAIALPFTELAQHPPTNPIEQGRAVAAIVMAIAPYVEGATVEQLGDAFIHTPDDMPRVFQAVMPLIALPAHTPRRRVSGRPHQAPKHRSKR